MSSYLVPFCFLFNSSHEAETGVQLGECHAVSTSAKNITFIRAHYITTDILVKMSFANSFQYSFPPGCPGRINNSFIGMWKKTSAKLITKVNRERGWGWGWRDRRWREVQFLHQRWCMGAICSRAVNTGDTKMEISLFCVHRHDLFSRPLSNHRFFFLQHDALFQAHNSLQDDLIRPFKNITV